MSGKWLQVAEDYRLPLEMLGDSTTIFGRKRTGKSNNAAVLVEEGLGAGVQFIITDPKGDWWGLLSSADGKSAGYPLVVIGGRHATVSLNVGAGTATAAWVKRTGYSVILDLQGLEDHEIERFMSAFLKELRRLQEEDHKNIVLVVDEADELAPEDQRARLAVLKTMGLLIWFVKRGGFAGVGTICITQRPASISKNITTQSETIIVLHVSGSQDLDAVADALKHHVEGATKKERTAALENLLREVVLLDKGATIIVSAAQGLKGTIHRIPFRRRKTFDSGATPKMGELPKVPKVVAKVDLQQLSTEMQRAVAEAAENDVPTLRKRIIALEQELKKKPQAPAPAPKRVDVAVLKDTQITRVEKLLGQWNTLIEKMVTTRDPLLIAFAKVSASSGLAAAPTAVATPVRAATPRPQLDRPSTAPAPVRTGGKATVRSGEPRATAESNGQLSRMQQRSLDILFMLERLGHDDAPKIAIAAWRGVKPGGSFSVDVARIVELGYAEQSDRGRLRLTDAGRQHANDDGMPTSLSELHERISKNLNNRERDLLNLVIEHHPRPLSTTEAAEMMGIKAGGSYSVYVSHLRDMGLVSPRGNLAATDILFPAALS